MSEQFTISQSDIYAIFQDKVIAMNLADSFELLLNQVDCDKQSQIFQSMMKEVIQLFESGESIYDIHFAVQESAYRLRTLRKPFNIVQNNLSKDFYNTYVRFRVESRPSDSIIYKRKERSR